MFVEGYIKEISFSLTMNSTPTIIPRKDYRGFIKENEFLEGFNTNWRTGGIALSIVLFFVWSLQLYSTLGNFIFAYIGGYSIIVIGIALFRSSQLEYVKTDASIRILYLRPAEIWDSLVDALTASGLIFAACVFFLTNTLSSFTEYAVISALVITCLLVPFAPLVSLMLGSNFLKTTVLIEFDSAGKSVSRLDIDVHPLERSWYDMETNELRIDVEHTFQTILTNTILIGSS